MDKTTGLTLIEWYIQREKENLQRHPVIKAPFFYLLKNRPEIMLNIILDNLEDDVVSATISGKLANPNISIYDSNIHAMEVLEAYKKEFII